MCGSNQAVSGRVLGNGARRSIQRMRAFPLIFLCLAVVSASTRAAADSPSRGIGPPPNRSETTHPTVGQKSKALTRSTSDSQAPFSLVGMGSRDLIDQSTEYPPPPADVNDPQGNTFADATTTKPVAIPFPTAVHLFIPGAIMAIYATRRFRGRRR